MEWENVDLPGLFGEKTSKQSGSSREDEQNENNVLNVSNQEEVINIEESANLEVEESAKLEVAESAKLEVEESANIIFSESLKADRVSPKNESLAELLEVKANHQKEDQNIELESNPGRYVFRQGLNKGGMKTIARVKDVSTSRDIAMAYLSEGEESELNIRRRFLQEARITANLEHPNIVPIHDIGIHSDNTPYFTMKLLGGESLAYILQKINKNEPGYREKYSLNHLLMIYLKILDAIEFAHSKGVIHLDLKPDNIQVGEYGEVLVLDWGLARILHNRELQEEESPGETLLRQYAGNARHNDTLDGIVKGTVGYMAPEQAEGRNNEKDERTDIYALGAILYSILTWKKSVKGNDIDLILDDIIEGNFIPLKERNPQVFIPPALEAVTLKAMSRNPTERYKAVSELKKDIMNYMEGYATDAEKAGLLRQCYLYVKRKKSQTIAFSIIFLTLLFSGMIWWKVEQKRIARWGHQETLVPNNDPIRMRYWHPNDGEWDISADKIRAVTLDPKPFRLQYMQKVQGNIAVEFDAMVESEEALKNGGDLSVILNWDPERNEEGYYFQIGGLSNSVASIQRRNGLHCMIPFAIEVQRKYHIRIEKEEGILRLYCDGKKLLETEDIFYLEGGFLGLYTFGGGKLFTNIKLYRRGIPELVSPLIEGDGFYRQSRMSTSQYQRDLQLKTALMAYSRVYEDHQNQILGWNALLKMAYIELELGNLNTAQGHLYTLDFIPQTLPILLLRAELNLRTKNYQAALDSYKKALSEYESDVPGITGTVMARLSDLSLFRGADRERYQLWRLVVEHQTVPSFRCRSKGLETLEFLRTLRFRMLDISGNLIRDLSPLEGMPLKHLNCSGNPITSLDVLRDMQLTELNLSNTGISSLKALRGMPIKVLYLNGSPRINDFSELASLTALERISLPAQIKKSQLEFLKKLPNLKYISYDTDQWDTTASQFWEKQKNN